MIRCLLRSSLAALLCATVAEATEQPVVVSKTIEDVIVFASTTTNLSWSGGTWDKYANGEGTLTVFGAPAFPMAAKAFTVSGLMQRGAFAGWVEKYDYHAKTYWLGGVKEFAPIGCGVLGALDSRGGRVAETFQIVRIAPNRDVNTSHGVCIQEVEEKVGKTLGKKAGKVLVECLLKRKKSCLNLLPK